MLNSFVKMLLIERKKLGKICKKNFGPILKKKLVKNCKTKENTWSGIYVAENITCTKNKT